jgi:hypothetical protein
VNLPSLVRSRRLLVPLAMLALGVVPAAAQSAVRGTPEVRQPRLRCALQDFSTLQRNPTEAELRCRFGIHGRGRFGLSEYKDVPVYQPATPLPGTHVVGVAGLPGPRPGESYEEWEWRVLRTHYGPESRRAHKGLELLDPQFASRLLDFERRLREAGVRFSRRETWRSPDRQAFLFQSGRSRPGGVVTATLTSWHSRVDSRGQPSARAADYNVPRAQMERFHEVAWSVGLETFGPDSNDAGHVFLPGSDDFPTSELVFLRLLPRVPVVTIATGRPVDEPVSRDRRAELRQAAERFVTEPFFPDATLKLAGLPTASGPILTPVTPPAGQEWVVQSRPAGALTALLHWLRRAR